MRRWSPGHSGRRIRSEARPGRASGPAARVATPVSRPTWLAVSTKRSGTPAAWAASRSMWAATHTRLAEVPITIASAVMSSSSTRSAPAPLRASTLWLSTSATGVTI